MLLEAVPPVIARSRSDMVVLRLYVAGSTPQSSRAITNIKKICEARLKDRYVLTVMDLYEHTADAQADRIMVAPTLIRQSPFPERRLFGDLSQTVQLLAALDLAPKPDCP